MISQRLNESVLIRKKLSMSQYTLDGSFCETHNCESATSFILTRRYYAQLFLVS